MAKKIRGVTFEENLKNAETFKRHLAAGGIDQVFAIGSFYIQQSAHTVTNSSQNVSFFVLIADDRLQHNIIRKIVHRSVSAGQVNAIEGVVLYRFQAFGMI